MKELYFKRLESKDIQYMKEILENDNMKFSEENVANFIENSDNYGFIGIQENKIIAFLYGYGMLRPDGRRMFYIHSVDVLESYQCKGVGTELMKFTLNYIKAEGKYYKYFVLTDNDNIKACNLYKKFASRDEQVLFSNKI